MSERRTPLFLERQSYRRRRLIDMIRMLPVIGALLWAVPLLWRSGPDSDVSTSTAIIYLFGVWLAMVLWGGAMAKLLKLAETEQDMKDT